MGRALEAACYAIYAAHVFLKNQLTATRRESKNILFQRYKNFDAVQLTLAILNESPFVDILLF